jgi:CRP/FNR family transcriptional regulator, cyclic AMP receptor protein
VSVDIDFLKTLPRFRGMGDTELLGLSRAIRELGEVRPGHVVFDKGAPADGAYIVKTGRLNVEVPMPDGTGRVVAHLGPGTMVGELCLVEDAPRSLRVRASAPSELLIIDRMIFDGLRRKGHSAAYKLIRSIAMTVCDRLRNTNLQIEGRWKGVTGSTTEMEVVNIRKPGKVASASASPVSAWDKLRGLFGRG